MLAAIILARLDSQRFPNKALSELNGLPIIGHVLRRLERTGIFEGDRIMLATTARDCDTPLAECFEALGGRVYRGPEPEVWGVATRFVSAADSLGADHVLRVNGDSPFPDRWLIEQGLALMNAGDPDLVTNLLPRTYPYGISVEWVKIATLKNVLPGLTARQQEHLTGCFYDAPESFDIVSVPACPWPWQGLRFTVDEPHELAYLESIADRLQCPLLDADLPSLIAAAAAVGGPDRSVSF